MTKESDDYEHFVAKLIENIKNSHRNIGDIGYGGKNLIRGVCGQGHQIDVSFIDHDFPTPTLFLIECKHRSKSSIAIEYVKVLKATQDDIIPENNTPKDIKAIMVTTKGVQKGAGQYAKYYGINIEILNSEDNFTFRYENIVQAKISDSFSASADASNKLFRKCSKCENQFEVQVNELICPFCD